MINNKNIIKEKIKNNEKCLVAWAQASSNITAEILASSGFDGVLIDMEHAPGDFDKLITQLQALNGYSAVPIVRVAWNDSVLIKKTLDAGAYGIHVPYVDTAEEARAAVAACKYPPHGIRGLAASPRAACYGNNSPEYFKRANEDILIVVSIESLKAVENIDEILAVEGIDAVFIGPADLSTSMGHLGNFNIPEVQEKIHFVEEKIIASGKKLVGLGMDWETAQKKFDKGASIVLNMSDTTTLGAIAREKVSLFKSKYN